MSTEIVHRFETLKTADILDALADAVDAARASTAPAEWRWAIDTAWDQLLQLDAIEYDLAHYAIRIESATTPGTVYESNGACQCPAFTKGKGVCWHRAAARLIRRALELRDIAAEVIDCRAAEGETISPASAAYVARVQHAEVAAVAVAWDAESERQRLALVSRISAARTATAQSEMDELYPRRLAA